MCAAVDMVATEQLFNYSHSPPASFLADYTPQVRRPMKITTRGYSAPCISVVNPVHVQLTLKPASRSCLRIPPKENKKKKVVFADERGFRLEQVKILTEPSHIPPYWTLNVVSSPTFERKAPPKTTEDLWEMRFDQPASNYIEFRRRVTDCCVSLENIIVKQNEGAIDGTVKVKNLDFTKEVLIRTTSDGWRTHEDTYCAFLESGPVGKYGESLYDTFCFRLQLPIHSRRLDFCVCFKCKGNDYWDNNSGRNYTVEKSSVRNPPGVSCARLKYGNSWSSRTDNCGNTPYW